MTYINKAPRHLNVGINQGDLRHCPEGPGRPKGAFQQGRGASGTPQRERLETGRTWCNHLLRGLQNIPEPPVGSQLVPKLQIACPGDASI